MISSCLVHAVCALVPGLGAPTLGALAAGAERPSASLLLGGEDVAAPVEEPAWTFDAFVYYWAAGVTGDLTVDGEDIGLEGGGDGYSGEMTLSGFLGHFEAHHGPWSFALAPIFVNVDATGSESGGVDADVEIHAQIHEGFVTRGFAQDWDWLAGARYYQLDTGVDLSLGGTPAGSLDNNHAWVDPIAGLRYHDDFGEHWSLRARGDVGGFGVGSQFAWNLSAFLGYRFGSGWAAQLGYRVLSLDFERGSGSDRLAYDLTMGGPIIGVSYSF